MQSAKTHSKSALLVTHIVMGAGAGSSTKGSREEGARVPAAARGISEACVS